MASGVCRFCGRAACREHAKTKPFLFEAWVDAAQVMMGLAVEDAVHCGICKVTPEPVDVGFLRSAPERER